MSTRTSSNGHGSAAEARRTLRALLEGLPEGEPHKIGRPPGPPSTWPQIVPAPRRRAA